MFFNVTAENQARADERVPLLLDLPFRHKGVMVAPFIGEVSLKKYLKGGAIERVVAGGENYDGSRVLKCEWVEKLYSECVESDTTFCFIETGTLFEKGGKIYRMPDKRLQSKMAFRSGYFHGGGKRNTSSTYRRRRGSSRGKSPNTDPISGPCAPNAAAANLQRLRQMPQMPEYLTPSPTPPCPKMPNARARPHIQICAPRFRQSPRAKFLRQHSGRPHVFCERASPFSPSGIFRQIFGIVIYLRPQDRTLEFSCKCVKRKGKQRKRFP